MIRRLRRRLCTPDLVAFVVAMLGGWIVVAQDGAAPRAAGDVSDFVYPQGADTLRFEHDAHDGVACVDCHGAARTSRRASDDLRPPMKVCAGCHSSDVSPPLTDCSGCHLGHELSVDGPVQTEEQWREVRPAPMIPPRPSPNLRFDHAAHASTPCQGCHAGDPSGAPTMPTMDSCTRCHDATSSAPDTCTTCHPTDPGTGRIATKRRHVPTSLKPDDHGVDFARRHGTVMRGDADDCMSCHTEEDCATCHTESVATPFAVHPPNFMTIHAVDARSGAGECTDCHAVQTFCTTCHVRADVTTRQGHRPPPRRQFHPTGWLDATTPNNHGVMSRRDITECASCHSESDCISCHAGVDPHPPEFRLECGRLLAANPTPCARCHDDPGALRLMCQ